VALAVTFLRRDLRITFKKFMAILEDTGLAMLEVAVVCGVAGVLIVILTLTGLTSVFTLFVGNYGADNLFLILLLTGLMLSSSEWACPQRPSMWSWP
jgi:TRAP-type uncharacterized transport system fused permease subunit